MVDHGKEDSFPDFLGVEILELKPGYARVGLQIKENMVNIHQITHGGVIFTLADVALGRASNTHGPKAVAINVNINFLKVSRPGDYLVAIAREEKITRRTGVYRVEITNQQQEKIAVAQGLVYRQG